MIARGAEAPGDEVRVSSVCSRRAGVITVEVSRRRRPNTAFSKSSMSNSVIMSEPRSIPLEALIVLTMNRSCIRALDRRTSKRPAFEFARGIRDRRKPSLTRCPVSTRRRAPAPCSLATPSFSLHLRPVSPLRFVCDASGRSLECGYRRHVRRQCRTIEVSPPRATRLHLEVWRSQRGLAAPTARGGTMGTSCAGTVRAPGPEGVTGSARLPDAMIR